MSKPMVKLIALDRMRYRTRRLLAGDEFEAKPSEAKIWVLLKKAKEAPLRPPAPLARPPAALVRKVAAPKPVEAPAPAEAAAETPTPATPDADLAATREEYQTKLGKRPFHGWDVEELRRRISEAE
jgi:hypothetical protein